MAGAITFNGFNDIDFSVVVNALMQQASQPLTTLQQQQQALQTQVTNFGAFSTRVLTLESAASDLSSLDTLSTLAATSSAPGAVSASAGADATAGDHDVVVNELARAQVTASTSTVADPTTTIVASGGSITIGGVAVQIGGDVTLRQLADAINATDGIGVHASVIRTGPAAYRLALTGSLTGESHAFTITNGLSGGAGVTFADTDNDGTSGDSAGDNAVNATNASILVDNIAATSESNTFQDVIPGVTLTVATKDPTATVHVQVAPDSTALQDKVQAFVNAYNDIAKFLNDQRSSAAQGNASSIGRDPLLRQLHNSLRNVLIGAHGTDDTLSRLSQVGVEFTQDGTIELKPPRFADAIASDEAGVRSLFSGPDGVFPSVKALVDQYSQADGLIDGVKTRLTQRITLVGSQIDSMQARLAQQRDALQKQFTEADVAISRLRNQSGSLASFGSSLTNSL